MRINLASAAFAALALPLAVTLASAQSGAVDRLTQTQLEQKAQALTAMAETGGGSASTKLEEYPNHFTMIALRVKSGGVEVHEHFADFFYVVKGRANLLSGGKVVDPKVTGPGEILGASMQGGTQQALKPGDFVHIPAGVPHQLLLPAGGTFAYYVIKVKEN